MHTIIWALGAVVVFSLLMLVIPLGFTNKGKVIVVLTSFVLALAGGFAADTFPMWQTGLILVLLVLIASYFMSTRMSAMFFNTKIGFSEDFNVEMEEPLNSRGNELPSISEPVVLTKKMNTTEVKNDNTKEVPQQVSSITPEPHVHEEDISFLLERIQEPDPEKKETNIVEDTGYLDDIENLLFSGTEEDSKSTEDIDDSVIDELDEEEVSLEDLILAVKEAAPSSEDDDVLEEINFQKKD